LAEDVGELGGLGEGFSKCGREGEDEVLEGEICSVGSLTYPFDCQGEGSPVFVEREGIVSAPKGFVVFGEVYMS
jgi:hypothetical protein